MPDHGHGQQQLQWISRRRPPMSRCCRTKKAPAPDGGKGRRGREWLLGTAVVNLCAMRERGKQWEQ
eukprot:12928414-Prorocentrum_lima.AAC.1